MSVKENSKHETFYSKAKQIIIKTSFVARLFIKKKFQKGQELSMLSTLISENLKVLESK